MLALAASIHVLNTPSLREDVDRRDKPDHGGEHTGWDDVDSRAEGMAGRHRVLHKARHERRFQP